MKKISIVCLTGLLLFTACENTGSSTVGSYDKEETTQSSSEKTESGSGAEPVKTNTENVSSDTVKAAPDSMQNTAGNTGTNASKDSMK